jgi:signal transduction histidine kinase/DNA-binding NarL/FixJ family response regulator/HPt (histidine-containing phosphotransfer) domain-containing protein
MIEVAVGTRSASPSPSSVGRAGRMTAPPPPRSVALQLLIVSAALLLVALTWAFTYVSIGTEEREAQAHAESNVANLALAVEWQLERQLQTIDEAMQVMAAAWRTDPRHFDPAAWQRRSSLLSEISPQVYLLDANGFVMAASTPELLGADFSERDYFQAQKSSLHPGLFVGPAIQWKTTGRWEINLSRRLERNDGGFAGAIVVAYDPWTLTTLLEQVDVGARGLIALVGSDGAIRALVSPYEVRPGEDISQSRMFKEAVQAGNGPWTGLSAPDLIERVHAVRRVPAEDLTIVVGVEREVALRPARAWALNARAFAGGMSLALLVMAVLLLREVRAARGREVRLAESQSVLRDAYAELAAANASAERKAAQLEATLAGMSDGVMLLDANLRLVQWNDRFPAFTGTPPELLQVGLPMQAMLRAQALAGEFGDVDVEAEVKRRIDRLHAHLSVGVMERTRPNGRTLELRRSALPDGGFVTLYTDITARKQAEEAQAQARRLAEEAMEQKSRFVAIVSHEIRTPLNAVVNSLALLDQSALTQAQHVLAETAKQAGEALLDLVRDILDLSRAEAGQLAIRPTVFELRPLLQGVREMFRAQAAARRVTLVLDVAPELPVALCADRGRLRQVVMNLVSNAAKFANPGTVTIRAMTTIIAGNPTLLLGVRDQGPRIPEREAAKLFQPFSRLESAHAGGTPGSGLGLAICERLTRLMGGQIGLGPSPEGGNEFWVTLPMEMAAALPPPAAAEPLAPPRRQRHASLLLVEDLAPNQLITATLLRRGGHRVDVASSGQEAVDLVKTRPYDLVFMDLVMPGMSGYEAARQIRALPPPMNAVPIVALTATTAAEDRARCIAVGMDDFLAKPVRGAELIEVVARTAWSRRRAPAVAPQAAAPAAPADAPLLDDARMDDLRRGLPPATLGPLVEQCLADFRQRLPQLHAALQTGQFRAIEENAHALAGMAGNFALSGLERRMRRIMAAARGHDLGPARAAAEDVEALLARTTEAMHLALRAVA